MKARMVRILLSALAARRGGGIAYVRNIMAHFPDQPGLRLSVLAHRREFGDMASDDRIEWIAAPRWAGPAIPRFLIGFVYFRFIWQRRREFDVLFNTGGSFDVSLPRPVKRVISFQNMLPFDLEARRRYPPGWMRIRHWLLWYVQGWAIRRADFVIFISDHGRRVADKRVGPRRGGSAVIRHGVARSHAPLDAEIAERLPNRFVLYLSAIEPYKAQLELLEAWALARRSGSLSEKLVLAGPAYPPYARRVSEAILRLRLESEVVLLGPVAQEQVFDLAARASLNLFLSTCENCPVTLLELMSVGRPLLISSREPMPELGGPELAYVDPLDPQKVAAAIENLLGDDIARAATAETAAERASMFRWDQCATATWQAIQTLIEQRAPRRAPSSGASLATDR